MTARLLQAAAAAWAAMALAGCALGEQLLAQRSEPEPEPPGVALHLAALTDLVSADEAEQQRQLEAMELAWAYYPTTGSGLRLALALATPGHPGYAPERARTIIESLLQNENALMDGERELLALRRAELRSRVEAEEATRAAELEAAQRTADRLHEAHAELEQALQHASRLETHNRELTEALREAESKLEAITTIERTIRERDEVNGAD